MSQCLGQEEDGPVYADRSTTVIIRTRQSVHTLTAALDAVRTQTVPAEIIVVDSGSTDGTLEVAHAEADRVLSLSPNTFSYGRALNLGIAAARTSVIFALSSHALPPGPEWLARSLDHHADPQVIATCGAVSSSDGAPLDRIVRQDHALARAHPFWGLTNTAASWRADLACGNPFDEQLEACEDKEWALRALEHGGVVVVDPALAVDGLHRRKQGLAEYFDRVRREHRAMVRIGALPRRSAREIAGQWIAESRRPPQGQRGFTSLSRLIDHAAAYAAQRDLAAPE